MKPFFRPVAAALGLAALLTIPSSRVQSQIALGPDLLTILQQAALKNEQLIKSQEESLKTLEDLLLEARQARVFSKRG